MKAADTAMLAALALASSASKGVARAMGPVLNAAGLSLNHFKREAQQEAFRERYAEPIAKCEAFNRGVNTRQVRRLYARIMEKRNA